jgi:CRISP-associated protein Cas1
MFAAPWRVSASTPRSAVGFLHADRPGRPSRALDLVEEFRPFFADRLALNLINRRQLGPKDFRRLDNGATLLTEEGRKAVLIAYQERKRDEIQHPFLDEKVTVGLLWLMQAQLLARHLRGDLDAYPPFVWR